MCEFHDSTCNGLEDIWWTDNPIYFSSIDYAVEHLSTRATKYVHDKATGLLQNIVFK